MLFVLPPSKDVLGFIQFMMKTAVDLQLAAYQRSYLDRLQSPARPANPPGGAK